ncbi:hypothetical protein Tcan_16761 [Toxocara canis]|uniref:Uncharacterized protein n=1 Tax=Toxocara canis TaxID=6265 RepID=A0A0B2UXQ5_TOXCA|nr:hypothetical protein Tcan_16761 [Toxocara canis]
MTFFRWYGKFILCMHHQSTTLCSICYQDSDLLAVEKTYWRPAFTVYSFYFNIALGQLRGCNPFKWTAVIVQMEQHSLSPFLNGPQS